MSKAEAALIASRAFCIYFLCWAIDDLSFIPGRIYALYYHESILGMGHISHVSDLISLSGYMIRAAALFIAAAIFYDCGPRLQALFLNSQPEKQSQPQ